MLENIYDIALAAVQTDILRNGWCGNIMQRALFIIKEHEKERYPNGMEERLFTPMTKKQLDRVRELKCVTVQLLSLDDKADRKTIRAQYERKKVQNTKDQSRFKEHMALGGLESDFWFRMADWHPNFVATDEFFREYYQDVYGTI